MEKNSIVLENELIETLSLSSDWIDEVFPEDDTIEFSNIKVASLHLQKDSFCGEGRKWHRTLKIIDPLLTNFKVNNFSELVNFKDEMHALILGIRKKYFLKLILKNIEINSISIKHLSEILVDVKNFIGQKKCYIFLSKNSLNEYLFPSYEWIDEEELNNLFDKIKFNKNDCFIAILVLEKNIGIRISQKNILEDLKTKFKISDDKREIYYEFWDGGIILNKNGIKLFIGTYNI